MPHFHLAVDPSVCIRSMFIFLILSRLGIGRAVAR